MKGHESLKKIRFYPQLREYENLAYQFVNYLEMTENVKIGLEGLTIKGGRGLQVLVKDIPYIHRWSECYLDSRLAKLYKLEAWVKEHPTPVTMATYTTFHDYTLTGKRVNEGYSIEQSFKVLNDGLRRSTDLLRKIRGGPVQYMNVLEPHPKSGYPHAHVMYLSRITDQEQERLKNHWANVVGAGDYQHGLNFSVDSVFEEGEIQSVRNYLMKYMAKTLYDGWRSWTPQELVFNAVAWGGKRDPFKANRHYRTFQPSRELSKIMAPDLDKKPWEMWVRTSIKGDEPILLRETDKADLKRIFAVKAGEAA